jgi:hypothetical protein
MRASLVIVTSLKSVRWTLYYMCLANSGMGRGKVHARQELCDGSLMRFILLIECADTDTKGKDECIAMRLIVLKLNQSILLLQLKNDPTLRPRIRAKKERCT